MGVPAFYRWLSEKYPKVVEDVLEERVRLSVGSNRLPYDWSTPNPSGLECDNLYIDMNGIIHPCSHPENGPQPTCEEEMFENVCRYVDRLVRVIRPRQLLYLAVDGVAPRAKMNQQRARRFRAAQEARENQKVEDDVRQELLKLGQKVPPTKKPWDSNVITPGTKFMLNLSEFLRFYVRKRLTESKTWQHLRVIYSDASIPGEGEHKIMSHIRLQRCQAGYDPNLVHVLHGLDADLIMLALATHETYFYISRELVLFGRKSQEQLEQRQLESGFQEAQRLMDEDAGGEAMELEENKGKALQRVSIPLLREYLANEFAECMQPGRLPFAPSLERLIDDFVFMCFFVGNDFLPHLPSLDIRYGALDYLLNVYKRLLPTMGNYITNHGGIVNLSQVDLMLAEVGAIEDHVFAMKHANELREKERQRKYKQRVRKGVNVEDPRFADKQNSNRKMGRAARILVDKGWKPGSNHALHRGHAAKEQQHKELISSEENTKVAESLKKSLVVDAVAAAGEIEEKKVQNLDARLNREREGDFKTPSSTANTKGKENGNTTDNDVENSEPDNAKDEVPKASDVLILDPKILLAFKERVKQEQQKQLDEYAQNVEDNVRLHESGWKDRYYSDKCKADDVTENGGREHLFRSYIVGLCWVMKYYYDGCPSWKWYYPFHYGPFASDLRNIERFQSDINLLELNEPFKPIEQLMSVLPEDSSHAIPKPSRWLMSDRESPIIDFYPKDVPVDPNGKAMPWLWVVLLPFIDEDRLLGALRPTQEAWAAVEKLANTTGLDDGYLYIHKSHGLMRKVEDVYNDVERDRKTKTRVAGSIGDGVKGFTGSVRVPLSNEAHKIDDHQRIELPLTAQKINRPSYDNLFADAIETSAVHCVAFTEPGKLSHKSILLPGARQPRPSLKPEDKVIRRPRLNRGGGTIANLGSSNGKSYQSGYGSMNISQYERDLAVQNGRGKQMYQTGVRAWGAAEPTPKRRRFQTKDGSDLHQQQHQFQPNPFNRPSLQTQQSQNVTPPWQDNQGNQQYRANSNHHRGQQHQYVQGRGNYQHNGLNNQQHQQQQQQQQQHKPPQKHNQVYGQHNQYNQQVYKQDHQHNNQQGYNQEFHQQGYQGQGRNRPYTGHQYNQNQQSQQQQQQSFNFQDYNRSATPSQSQTGQSRVNPSVMSSLRSQLANTLQQHRQGRNQKR
mmetsp:Transcript_29042/g.32104  ORF Transcript_29042/g.32104 Transcript_29042/m.32104 type:complete len:1183 (-) Transcript_29042:314-3862(-)